VEELRGERVRHRDICDGDAPRDDHNDVPASLDVVAEPSTAVPEPAARPTIRRSGGLRAEAIPARCTARHNIPFRMSWRSVSCAARDLAWRGLRPSDGV
jgi:hypothetical protein